MASTLIFGSVAAASATLAGPLASGVPRGLTGCRCAPRPTAFFNAAPGRLRSRQVASRGRAGVGLRVRAETQYLTEAKEGKELVDAGYTIVDVRDPKQWEKAHIKGSVHVPYFILNEDSGIETAIKRQAHNNFAGMLYGLAFTKLNPSFLTDIQRLFPDKSAKLLLVCQEGLRSSTALDALEDLGYTNLAILERGLNKASPGIFDKEGPKELCDAGKGGFVSIQTQFSIVLASILISALLFLQFFPDTALRLFGEVP